uniref:DNA 3'-5' helicase n=1 Tax=Pyricularia oryzae TaxID=318829 RepID=C3VIP9_PYROR|nr:TLH5 [Pyricularia oryzae]
MADIRPYVWVSKYKVVICTQCQFANAATEVEPHLRGTSHKMRPDQARKIAAAVGQLPNIYQDHNALREFAFPPPTCPEIPLLRPAQRDGFGCAKCGWVCRQENSMRDHYRSKHAWQNPRTRGGKQVAAQLPWRTGVRLQRFFKNRQASSWFEVERPRATTDNPPVRAVATIDDIISKAVKLGQEKMCAMERIYHDRVEMANEKLEPNLWVQEVGWSRHLRGFSRMKIMALIDPIKEKERTLEAMWQSFHRAARQGQRMILQGEVDDIVLKTINRKDGDKRSDKRFSAKMEAETWKKYTEVMRQVICYMHRSQAMEDEERPAYRLTLQQGEWWDAFENAAAELAETRRPTKEQKERLDRLCVDAVVGLMDQILLRTGYENAVISGLAVMGLLPMAGWASPLNYTPKYSAVIKMTRILLASQIKYEDDEEMERLEAQGLEAEEANEQCVGMDRRAHEKVMRFMVRPTTQGRSSPMGWIYDRKAYGMAIRNTTVAEGFVSWKGDTITYRKIQFGMGQLVDIVHGMVAEAREVMAELLIMPEGQDHEQFPAINWAGLHDDQSDEAYGYSFLRDERNEWPVDGKTWLMGKISQQIELKRAWAGTEASPFSGEQVRRYERSVERFREQILLLMHITGGQPARGTEIIGLRMWNTGGGGTRNVFVDNGLISFVVLYHKNIRTTERAKAVSRFVPREVGLLLMWYMWLVLPFWQQVQGVVEGGDEASAFLWANKVMFSKAEESEDEDEEDDWDEDEDEDEDENEAEGARSTRVRDAIKEQGPIVHTAKAHGVWQSDRIRRRLQQHTQRFMGPAVDIISWRNIVVAISNRYLEGAFKVEGFSEDDDEDDGQEREASATDVLVAQTGHGARTRGIIYGLEMRRNVFGTANMRQKFRMASTQWHRFLGFGDKGFTDVEAAGTKRKRDPWSDSAEEARARRFKRMRVVDIHGALQRMMGEGAEFRGCQEQVVRSIFKGLTPIVQITGTGGGKSLSFILPAFCTGITGTTIVVVPLVALREDLWRRCRESGIEAHVWTSRGANRAAAIVFVTPESASTKMFRDFVNRLRVRQQLDRVVVDECHMVLDAGSEFRPQLGLLGRTIAGWGVQVVCLTATLSPRDEEAFHQAMGFQGNMVTIYRVSTSRHNIEYRVRYTKKVGGKQQAIEEAVEEAVGEARLRYGDDTRMIVYRGTIKRTETIGESLGCPIYHAGVADENGKKIIMQAWMREGGVIAATNALGVGLDVPDVRAVIHAGAPRRLRDYAQESGRAGRDGQKSEAIIMLRAGEGGVGNTGLEVEMVEYICGDACRRSVLDEVMDGQTDRASCAGPGEEVCDVCQARGLGAVEQEWGSGDEEFAVMEDSNAALAESEQGRRREQQRQEWWLGRYLESWAESCVSCRLTYDGGFRHGVEDCPRKEEQTEIRTRIEARAGEIQRLVTAGMERFGGCGKCMVPQAYCGRWVEVAGDEGQFRLRTGADCDKERVLFEVVAGFQDQAPELFREEMKTRMGDRHWDGKFEGREAWKRMGKRVKWGRMETNELCILFFRLVEIWSREMEGGGI